MRVAFGNLARQTESLRPQLDDALSRVVAGGRYIFGDEVEAFEEEFAEWCGATYAVGVANGTDAIAIALAAAGVQQGDEVITAANTCVPTVAGIEMAGAAPVLVDPDPRTRTVDPQLVEEAIGPRTRAILPVHLYGSCADLDSLARIAADHGLLLVEDCAQAHGAELRGRRAGSVGDAAAFSFYPTKNLGALGDAGAVVTSNAEIARRARLLRNYGERERFEHILRGRNSRLDAVQAALLRVKLPYVDGWNARRRDIAAQYGAALAGSDLRPQVEADGGYSVYHLYVVEAARRDVLRERFAGAGIETAVHYPIPIHRQPAYRDLGARCPLPASEHLASHVVSLPIYPELTEEEVEVVCAALSESPRPSPAPG